jgi:hypothetical protein
MRNLFARKNGGKEAEHPKPQIEFLENSLSLAESLATTKNITIDQALQVLVFNELRCIHFHFDQGLVVWQGDKLKDKKSKKSKEN